MAASASAAQAAAKVMLAPPPPVSVVPPPDYDWETNDAGQVPISCVSLGCTCAVAACLSYLNLREAAYPFDWNRTTIEGVIHFIRTGFADFLQFFWAQAFPGGKATGGTSYHGAHHSVWHEDMASDDGAAKYHRRIQRFFKNAAARLLFVRVLNTNAEVANARLLLEVLQALFVRSEVYLLLVAVCQPAVKSFVVEGTQGRLLVHCIEQWPHDVLVYKDAIIFAHRHASAPVGAPIDPSVRLVRSCEDMLGLLTPFFGGAPQQVPFCPRPLYMPLVLGQDGKAHPAQPPPPPPPPALVAPPPAAVGGAAEEARGGEAQAGLPAGVPSRPLPHAWAADPHGPQPAPPAVESAAAAAARTNWAQLPPGVAMEARHPLAVHA